MSVYFVSCLALNCLWEYMPSQLPSQVQFQLKQLKEGR